MLLTCSAATLLNSSSLATLQRHNLVAPFSEMAFSSLPPASQSALRMLCALCSGQRAKPGTGLRCVQDSSAAAWLPGTEWHPQCHIGRRIHQCCKMATCLQTCITNLPSMHHNVHACVSHWIAVGMLIIFFKVHRRPRNGHGDNIAMGM